MSHPYMDHYPIGENINEQLSDHEKRIKELESKLGAADRTSAVTAAKPMRPAESATGTTAAPNVSAQRWFGKGLLFSGLGDRDAARACDLAAAVTEWYERPHRGDADEADLYDLIGAFARGEPLPQKGG